MKRRLMTYVALAVCTTFMFGNCKKNSDAPAANFSPLTAGSTWTYQTNTGSYTLTATNRDTTVGSRTYRVLTNSAGPNNYLNKTGNDYYRFGVVPALGAGGLEELYLKDNVDVNGVWTDMKNITVPGTGAIPVTLTYTVKSKGGSRTVSGRAFNNVTLVKLDVTAPFVGAVATGDFYYADGVGMIEEKIDVNNIPLVGIPASTTTTILTSFTIR